MSYELEGQKKFYELLVELGIIKDENEINFAYHTDGHIGNVLIENKKEAKDCYYSALSQAIKYAARIMWGGQLLPAFIIINGLNDQYMYVFKTEDFISEIEAVKIGESASKNNSDYYTDIEPIDKIKWTTLEGKNKFNSYINSNEPAPKYHVSVLNVVGLSKIAYNTFKMTKSQFLDEENGELRKPTVLADRIYPYEAKTNDEFKRIMDILNTPALQKELGAYYTPNVYVKKAQEYLMNAIADVPEGMNYVVIDRCAGTGNLEDGLSDEVLSHCILNTIEEKEFVCLAADFGYKCLAVTQEDALDTDILKSVKPYVEDENTVVILFENPPYSEAVGGNLTGEPIKKNPWRETFIHRKMMAVKGERGYGSKSANDLAHLFIFSAQEYYMTGEYDVYIVFDPLKYWKGQNLMNKNFREGCLCNRKGFHATPSAISLIAWGNKEENVESLTLDAIEIDGAIVNTITTKKSYHLHLEEKDGREFEDDIPSVALGTSGDEHTGRTKVMVKPIYNDNIIGYFMDSAFPMDAKNCYFVRLGLYAAHGFYMRDDNFLKYMPMYTAARAHTYLKKWYQKDVYYKTIDGGLEYMNDNNFVRKCLLWTMLAPNTKHKSLVLSNGQKVANRLAFEEGTIGYDTYYKMRSDKVDYDSMTREELIEYMTKDKEDYSSEDKIITFYNTLVENVKTKEDYGKEEYNRMAEEFGEGFTIGLWQIIDNINIYKDPNATRKTKKYKKLDAAIKSFKSELEKFYINEILNDLFKYELIK